MPKSVSYNEYYEYALSMGWDEKDAARYAWAKSIEKKLPPKQDETKNERLEGL